MSLTNQISKHHSLKTPSMQANIFAEQIATCHACNVLIEDKKMLKIEKLNLCFHVDHLECHYCKKDLSEISFFEAESNFYCDVCFNQNYFPTCFKCQKPISGQCSIADNKNYHSECFACHQCEKTILDKFFV